MKGNILPVFVYNYAAASDRLSTGGGVGAELQGIAAAWKTASQ